MENSTTETRREITNDVKPNIFFDSLFSGNQRTNGKSPANEHDLESGSLLSEKVAANLGQGNIDHSQMGTEDRQPSTDDTDNQDQTEAKEEHREPPKDHWKHFYDAIDQRDEEFCKALRDEISDLLLIAALLLGVVTAFTIEAFKWLREDPTVTLLQNVVQLLNESAPIGIPAIDPGLGALKDYELTVNQLWLLSMILSLSAVIFGTLCLQWLSAFRHADDKYTASPDTLALRQVRYEGIWAWGVPHIPALLIVTVQAALVFFIVGLLYLLWNVNRRAALPVAVVGGISTFAVAWTLLLPVLLSVVCYLRPSLAKTLCQCPYKNPWTWITHRTCTLLAIVFTFPFTFAPSKFRDWILNWRRSAVKLLIDFRWLEYDEMWRQRRDPGAKEGLCSYYLLNGLGAVVDTLGSHQSTGHFVEKCLQDLKFHDSPADIEAIKKSFNSLRFTRAEQKILEQETPAGSPAKSDVESKAHDLAQLRKDFLTALILEQLVSRSRPLKRSLLHLRVKHYIRVKALVCKAGLASTIPRKLRKLGHHDEAYIGKLLDCPIVHMKNAESLSPAERLQYINCIGPLITTNQFDDRDAVGFRLVLSAFESLDHRRSGNKRHSELSPTGEPTDNIFAFLPISPTTSTSPFRAVTPTPHDATGISHHDIPSRNQTLVASDGDMLDKNQDDHAKHDASLYQLRQARDTLDLYYPTRHGFAHHRRDDTYTDIHQCGTCQSWY